MRYTEYGRIIAYRVEWTVTVDHPELRDDTFPTVRPGHRIPMGRTVSGSGGRGGALALFAEVTGPEWRFASEWIRRRVYFERLEDGSVVPEARAA
jgi:hypothetical protein